MGSMDRAYFREMYESDPDPWQFESSRYEQRTQPEAQALFDAIDSKPDGVLQWIRNHW